MAKKLAFCRISDVEPLNSIALMLEVAGYDCVLPDKRARDVIRDLGCRNVDDPIDMQRRWGAELPDERRFPEVGLEALDRCDLYVDINGCRNGPLVAAKFPNVHGKVLTYFINGGEPRNTWDKGDNITPACPIVTTAQNYRAEWCCLGPHKNLEILSCDTIPRRQGYWANNRFLRPMTEIPGGDMYCPHEDCGKKMSYAPWVGKSYVHWPPFTRGVRVQQRQGPPYGPPVSFVHNCMSWGCGHLVPGAREMGVMAYGGGNSPDGLVKHEDCFGLLSNALCTVYLKGGGAVDYSVLEPMAAGCPVTVHQEYIDNCRLWDLLIPGETCLVFGGFKDTDSTLADIRKNLEYLRDPANNRRVGEAGRRRMTELMWSNKCASEINSWTEWLARMFP